jgi:hypothetical protein
MAALPGTHRGKLAGGPAGTASRLVTGVDGEGSRLHVQCKPLGGGDVPLAVCVQVLRNIGRQKEL